jgi:hypothetical protein
MALLSLHLFIGAATDEILLTTSAVIVKLTTQGLLDITKLTQRIDGIKIECKDLSANCSGIGCRGAFSYS